MTIQEFCRKKVGEVQVFLEEHDEVLFAKSYRDKNQRVLANAGSFQQGQNSVNYLNLKLTHGERKVEGCIRHPYKQTCVDLRHPSQKPQPSLVKKRQVEAFCLAEKIFKKIDPKWTASGISIQFTRHIGPLSRVDRHTDPHDSSFQYSLVFGAFSGATLVTTNSDGTEVRMPGEHGLFKFDGRLPHRVDFQGFQGCRYSLIAFKNYDPSKDHDEAIFEPGEMVFAF